MMSQAHSYPRDLVSFIFDLWQDPQFLERLHSIGMNSSFQLPDRSLFEYIVSACYQASLMREETRPVMFRLIIRPPELFPVDMGPPTGFHVLQFTEPKTFNEQELYKLAPAADFYRTLIGIDLDREARPQIWGLIHSGARLRMQTVVGGRKMSLSLPRQSRDLCYGSRSDLGVPWSRNNRILERRSGESSFPRCLRGSMACGKLCRNTSQDACIARCGSRPVKETLGDPRSGIWQKPCATDRAPHYRYYPEFPSRRDADLSARGYGAWVHCREFAHRHQVSIPRR